MRRVLFRRSSAFPRPSSLPPRPYSQRTSAPGACPDRVGASPRYPFPSPSTLNSASKIPARSGLSIEDSDPVETSVSFSLRSPALPNHPCNSHGIISFADPPPLNPIESYRSTKGGGWGVGSSPISAFYLLLSTFPPIATPLFSSASFLARANSFCVNLFADPHPLNPVLSIFYENIGGRGNRLQSSRNRPTKPFRIISFADPHPLTPIESYRSEKGGGRGHPCKQESFFSSLFSAIPLPRVTDHGLPH